MPWNIGAWMGHGKTQRGEAREGTHVAVALVAVAVLAFPVKGQQSPPPHPPRPVLSPVANRPPDANEVMLMQQKAQKKQNFEAANAERKKQLDKESANLLILARDLNAHMKELGSEALTPRMKREAEVIELLARDVQTKMKLTVGTD